MMNALDESLLDWPGPRYLRWGNLRRDRLIVLRHLAALSKTNASLVGGLEACAEEEAPRRGWRPRQTAERPRGAGSAIRRLLGLALFILLNGFLVSSLIEFGQRDAVVMGAGVTFIAVEMISALAYLAWWREGQPKSRGSVVITVPRWAKWLGWGLVLLAYNAGVAGLVLNELEVVAAPLVLVECALVYRLRGAAASGKPRRGFTLVTARVPGARAGILLAVRARLMRGQALSEAIAGLWKFFPAEYAGRMRAAEASGEVAACLGRLADATVAELTAEHKAPLKRVYLTFLLLAQVSITSFLLFKVVPVFREILKDFDGVLPRKIQHLDWFADYLQFNWPWTVILLSLSVTFVVLVYRGIVPLRVGLSRAALYVPVLGPAWRYRNAAKTTEVLGELVETGMPIPLALGYTAESGLSAAFAAELLRWKARAEQGESLAACAAASRVMPEGLAALLTLGEQGNCLAAVLGHAAAQYGALADRAETDLRAVSYPLALSPFALSTFYIVSGFFEAVSAISDNLFYAL